MKNIAIFCDGTWNAEDSTHRTNVALLSGALKREGTVPQVPIYLPGVGTGKGVTFVDRMVDKAGGGALADLGSHVLANVCATTKYGGVVTACGLAAGMDFPATVVPFILRGVTLAGIDSADGVLRLKSDPFAFRTELRPQTASVVQRLLPGMATDFYRTQVSRHLQIGIRAMEHLRDGEPWVEIRPNQAAAA